jgi:hypothetical protein
MRRRQIGVAVVFAAITAGRVSRPVDAIPIHVACPECDQWPVWVQVLLTVVGVALAMAVLYVPYRLSQNARTPRQGALILVGGVLLLIIGLVAGARLLVVLFPG